MFFVLLHPMKGYVKYLGLISVLAGLALFAIHIIFNIKGNSLLFSGLALVIVGAIAHVELEKRI
ncbi:hypothetical protein HMPREF0662_02453 [Prevotella nigrescens F0103]|nr:hypothetical protein [Prevotella nigrescens]ELX66285.1 hypothetical protein HMPREF0662_02453 [Prevotella nigrescens F0103]QUB53397.1 hypothetical protein J4865_07190 [Prevotella nigrescens F0103]